MGSLQAQSGHLDVAGQRRHGVREVRGQRLPGLEVTPRAPGRAASGRAAECARPIPGSTRRSKRWSRSTPCVQPCASSRVRSAVVLAGPGKQPAGQRAVIEAGAAGEDRQAAAARGSRRWRERRRARSRAAVYSSVGSAMSIRWCGMPRRSGDWHLVGADVEAAIDGGRIAVDDLAVEAFGHAISASELLPVAVGPSTARTGFMPGLLSLRRTDRPAIRCSRR